MHLVAFGQFAESEEDRMAGSQTLSRSPEGTRTPAQSPPSRKRSPFARISRAALITWLAGTLAFLLSASLLRDRSERIDVLRAAQDIPAGTELTGDLIETVSIPADSPFADATLRSGGLQEGMVVRDVVPAGAPILSSDLVRASAADQLRAMSVEVPREQAVGGDLGVGDRVDVIDVVDGDPRYVVTDVQVIDIASSGSSGGITGGGAREFYVVVRVDADQALAIAGALADADVQVIRSTGAEPVESEAIPREDETE